MRLEILESSFIHSAPSSSKYHLSPRVIIPSSLPPLLGSHSYLTTQGFHHLRLKLLKEASGWLPCLYYIICHSGLRSVACQYSQPLASPNTSSGILSLSNLSQFSRTVLTFTLSSREAIFHPSSYTKSPYFCFRTLSWIIFSSFLLPSLLLFKL